MMLPLLLQRYSSSLLWQVVIIAVLFPTTIAAFNIPPNDGYITDAASVLTADEESRIEQLLQAYTDKTRHQIAVLIVPDLQGEADASVALQVFREWGVGEKEAGNGVLVLHAYKERRVFIATGKGVEADLPDIAVAHIIDTGMIPYFQEGKYALGFESGIQMIQEYLDKIRLPSDVESSNPSLLQLFFFGGIFFFDAIIAYFARTKEWWAGGIFGGIIGIVIFAIFSLWFFIPLFIVVGLLLDYIISRFPPTFSQRRRSMGGYFPTSVRTRRPYFGGGNTFGGGAGRSY